ncbi:MAG: nucleotidyltransferase domain-containing protein, partial [Armatimonadetes bacterium]|nr:nucleotidyltransferase domain-containing protein [Armatimonadota bacterium]
LRKLLQEKGISVYKILIIGSFVKGILREDSDIDVIIVSKDFRNKSIFERVKLTTGIGSELVRMLKKPFDLIYYSDEEWEKENFLLINEAKKYGEVIYGSSP